MAFMGDYFIFDGIPCTEFGLRLYEINGINAGNGKLPSLKAQEDRSTTRYKTYYYGSYYDEPLTFKIVIRRLPISTPHPISIIALKKQIYCSAI